MIETLRAILEAFAAPIQSPKRFLAEQNGKAHKGVFRPPGIGANGNAALALSK